MNLIKKLNCIKNKGSINRRLLGYLFYSVLPYLPSNSLNRKIHYFVIRQLNKISGILPLNLIIEPINICNAKCITCPYPIMKRKKGVMSFVLFKRIIDDIIKNNLPIKRIFLLGFGEPLMDHGIFKKIRYVKDNTNIVISIVTNVSLLTKQNIEKLIKSKIDYVIFSFNGATKEDYGKIVGLNFEKMNENILNFINRRHELKAKKPELLMTCVLIKENEKNKYLLVKRWGRYFPLHFSVAVNWGGAVKLNYINKGFSNGRWVPCKILWDRCMISWDGKLTPCCNDYEFRLCIGDVTKQGLGEIYSGDKIKKIRKMHLNKDFDKIEMCKNCNSNYLRVQSLRYLKDL